MRILVASAVLVSFVLSVGAQELGRGALHADRDTSGLGRAPLPMAKFDGFLSGGTWGLKLGLGWAKADWDLGPTGGSKNLFAPQASLFYKVTDNLDVNFSMLVLSAEDMDDQLGSTQADMRRLALGLRYWIDTQSSITPYLGAGLGYYLLDVKTDNAYENGGVVPATVSVEDAPGALLEGGAAFQVSETFFICADLTYDFLLGAADATINDNNTDFDVKALSFNLGVSWMF